jgi:NAD(P)-dependent dehydrogenase (short-subunit alcohol dehydrogenase family)
LTPSAPSWLTDTASKHALYAAADSIRMELAPLGIAVSTMEPGEIATEIWVKQRGLVEKMTGHPLRSLCEDSIDSFMTNRI